MNLKIDPEFENLCRPLSKEEFNGLTQNLIDIGCTDSLKVWDDIIVDGHHRYKICKKHDIPFQITKMVFENRNDAILWIINNQLSRRNLSSEERKYLIGKKYTEEKKTASEAGAMKGESLGKSYPSSKPDRTSAKIAKECGVSEKTVRNAESFAKAVDELPAEERKEVLAGKKKLETEENKIITHGDPVDPPIILKNSTEDDNGDSEKLVGLKRYWKESTKKDRKKFIEWIISRNELKK